LDLSVSAETPFSPPNLLCRAADEFSIQEICPLRPSLVASYYAPCETVFFRLRQPFASLSFLCIQCSFLFFFARFPLFPVPDPRTSCMRSLTLIYATNPVFLPQATSFFFPLWGNVLPPPLLVFFWKLTSADVASYPLRFSCKTPFFFFFQSVFRSSTQLVFLVASPKALLLTLSTSDLSFSFQFLVREFDSFPFHLFPFS